MSKSMESPAANEAIHVESLNELCRRRNDALLNVHLLWYNQIKKPYRFRLRILSLQSGQSKFAAYDNPKPIVSDTT